MRRINDGDEALLCPGPLPSCNKPPQGSSQGAAGGRSGLQAIVRPRRLEARRSLSELRPLHLQRLQQLPRLLGVRFPFAFRVAHGHCIRLRRRSQHLFHSVGDKDDSIFSILLCLGRLSLQLLPLVSNKHQISLSLSIYMHTYIHTCTHTHTHSLSLSLSLSHIRTCSNPYPHT